MPYDFNIVHKARSSATVVQGNRATLLATAEVTAFRPAIGVVPLSPAIGADIVGLDLESLTAEAFLAMRRALLDHCVIRLRGYDISDAKQVEIARLFGAPVKSSVAR